MNINFIGKEIRSKYTYAKGKILGINEKFVIVSFIKEEEPIVLSFDEFKEHCLYDDEVKRIINEKQRKV